MNCSTCQEQLAELVTCLREDQHSMNLDWDVLLEHLSVCHDCSEEYRALREGFALVPLGLPQVKAPEDFANRVMQQIKSNDEDAPPANKSIDEIEAATNVHSSNANVEPTAATISSRQRWLSYVLAASLLGVFGAAQWWYLHRVREAAVAAREPDEAERQELLDQTVAQLEALRERAREPHVRLVEFESAEEFAPQVGQRPETRAHAVWDALAGELHVYAFDIEPLSGEQTYAIWLRSDDEPPRLVSEFNADKQGMASVVAKAPIEFDQALELLITIESRPIGNQPSGQTWLRGRLVAESR